MKLGKFGKSLAMCGFAVALLAGAESASAQNQSREYRDWQQAQRRAVQEQREYQRTRSARDYREWQQAQRQAQREYAEYQRSLQRGNSYGNVNPGRRVGWYRINRGGRQYEVNQQQYQILQNAVNQGYQQGYNAGARDRRYGRGAGYYSNDSVYRTGTYGYQSAVARDQYQYYFQQGFQRGYQDGYDSQFRYGQRTNNGLSILGNVLGTILQLVDQ